MGDGADRGEPVVPDGGPGSREFEGPWPVAASSSAFLDELFPPRVAPAEDRIF